MSGWVVTSEANDDLEEIHDYIAQRNPRNAARFIDKLEAKFQVIAEAPGMGRRRDHLAPGLRSSVLADYLIFYRATRDGVEIIRVLSGYRDIEALFRPIEGGTGDGK